MNHVTLKNENTIHLWLEVQFERHHVSIQKKEFLVSLGERCGTQGPPTLSSHKALLLHQARGERSLPQGGPPLMFPSRGHKPPGPRHQGSGDQQGSPVYLPADKFRASCLIRIRRFRTFLSCFLTGISMEINALSAVMLSALIWRQVAISLYLFWELSLDPMLFLRNSVPSEETLNLHVVVTCCS